MYRLMISDYLDGHPQYQRCHKFVRERGWGMASGINTHLFFCEAVAFLYSSQAGAFMPKHGELPTNILAQIV